MTEDVANPAIDCRNLWKILDSSDDTDGRAEARIEADRGGHSNWLAAARAAAE